MEKGLQLYLKVGIFLSFLIPNFLLNKFCFKTANANRIERAFKQILLIKPPKKIQPRPNCSKPD